MLQVRRWQEEQRAIQACTASRSLLRKRGPSPNERGATQTSTEGTVRDVIGLRIPPARQLMTLAGCCQLQGSAADVATAAMITINRNQELRDLGWRMLLQVRQRKTCATFLMCI